MNKTEKEILVKQLVTKLKEVNAIYLADFTGLNVETMTQLRRELRKEAVTAGTEIEFKVIKNTLINIAAKEAGIDGLEPYLEGPTVVALGNDIATSAKVLTDFADKHEGKPQVKAGVVEGNIFNAEQVKDLAKLPPREVILAQVLGALQSPIRGFASLLNETVSKFVRTVDAIAKAKEDQ